MTEDWREVAERVRNWGKWGAADQLGTLNYITPAHVCTAAGLVRQGKRFSLGNNIDGYGPQGASGTRRNPIHLMTIDGGDEQLAANLGAWGGAEEAALTAMFSGPMRYNDDYIMMPTQAVTQWDAISHVYYESQLYNGFAASAVTSLGATRDSIDQVAIDGHTVGRGVLLDVARHRKLDRLEPNTVISPEELDEVASEQGVQVGEGDIVVVRTGWWTMFTETGDGTAWMHGSPGLSWRCAEWLHNRRCAAVASDNIAVEVLPPETDVFLLFHMLTLRDMGLMLGEIWNLEALAQDCAEDGVYEFFLTAPALRITGGVGTPLNPVAIK
jgi:kynurenine formamidase